MSQPVIDRIPHLVCGTMVSTDLKAAQPFYEEFLNFDCLLTAPKRMLLRPRSARLAMDNGSDDFMVIEVQEVAEIWHPQNILNHWGFSVETVEEVDRIHRTAQALKDQYGIRRVNATVMIHGAYSFYMADRDMNWWEIECRLHGMSINDYFAAGDFVARA